MDNEKLYYTALDIKEMIGVSRGQAYKIIRELNEQLKAKGYIVIPGKISKKYFQEHCYGIEIA